MDRRGLRRYGLAALGVAVALLAINQLRDGDSRGATKAPPVVNPSTTAYVPAVLRGDPIPVVLAPAGLSAARGGSVLRGLAISAPGATPDEVVGIQLLASAAQLKLDPIDGVTIYRPHPNWLYLEGKVTAINTALAAIRYDPAPRGEHQLEISLYNKTLLTNPRKTTVPVQLT